jgi:hypothetical protein
MDLLSEMLSSLKCDSQALGTFDLHGAWGFDIEPVLPGYCYVGSCPVAWCRIGYLIVLSG